MIRCTRIGLVLVLLAMLVGCIPKGHRARPLQVPAVALTSATQEVGNDPLFTKRPLSCNWWTLFNDPQLNKFITAAFTRNPTLHEARANILLAACNAKQLRANLFPNVLWEGDVSMQKLSETGLIPFNKEGVQPSTPTPTPAGVGGIPVYFTQYETELFLTFDFDIWSKNRNNWHAALGEMRSAIADEAFSRLLLGIAVAQVYYKLQVDYKREEIAKAIVDNKSKYLELVELRVEGNIGDNISTQLAEADLVNAKQVLLQIQANIAVNEYQLKAYLAGQFLEEICQVDVEQRPLPVVPIPCNLPLNLIAHRPDITAQLWLIESAGKEVEVAKAGFYPDFNLTALLGFQTLRLPELLKIPSSVYYNIDPAFSLPIFDGGRLCANLCTTRINYNLAIYQYNDLVLNATKEVLEGIAILRNANKQLNEFKSKLKYQEQLFGLTRSRVEHNLDSDLVFLQSEEQVLFARDQEVVGLGNTLQAILLLVKALGGGYNPCMVNG